MLEPFPGQGPEGWNIRGDIPYEIKFGPSMGEMIDEVHHNCKETVLQKVGEPPADIVSLGPVGNFGVHRLFSLFIAISHKES